MKIHERYGVRYLNSWADAERGKVSARRRRRTPKTAHTVHREAHGLVADEVYPVVPG